MGQSLEERRIYRRDYMARMRAERPEVARAAKRKHYLAHRERLLAEHQERKKAGDRRHLGSHLMRSYGLTLTDFDGLVLAQEGRCAVCDAATADLHVDHCHVTNRVRGLLCLGCNVTLGNVKDSVDRLMGLASYLLQSQDVLSPWKG